MASILAAGAIGVTLPLLAKTTKTSLEPTASPHAGGGGWLLMVVKAFAGGVILATGLVHILPDAFDQLGSDCLSEAPWGKFPFAGFVAMMFALATLSMESLAMGFYQRLHCHQKTHNNGGGGGGYDDDEAARGSHTVANGDAENELIRRRIVSQILETGVVVHSTIIGISMGTSNSVKTIKPLIVALSFHQFFEGVGLGGSILQAEIKLRSRVVMALFFSITAPLGIGIGMAISSNYKEGNPNSLIVEGMFTSASAGILIYMALVDLLATDFMGPNMLESDFRIQLGAYAALFAGAASMSVLALFA
ncbi:unnamed protein product [Linum trigynum]|uniref:Uncharacterized protein n=1 Tax=Linum trigynum TaxID=586398 RepID=A0AAV2EUU6_9ROSI